MLESYSPKDVSVSMYGFDVSGFSDNMVEVNWDGGNVNTALGVNGRTFTSSSASRSGKITMTLLCNSEANGMLESLYLLSQLVYTLVDDDGDSLSDELRQAFQQGIVIHNNTNGMTIIAPNAYLDSHSNISYGADARDRTWTFVCPTMTMIPSTGVGKALGLLNIGADIFKS